MAEISVVNAGQERVSKAVGEMKASLPAGIYKVRIRVGPSVEEKLVSLDQDRALKIDTLKFPSPIPLNDTLRSHEYHQAAAHNASITPRDNFGAGASILVFARDWTYDGTSSVSNPAVGLSLLDDKGQLLANIEERASIDARPQFDPSAGWRANVDPGAYRLRLQFSDGSEIERALYAASGTQTQIFLLLREQTLSSGQTECRADLTGGTISISPTQEFDPADQVVRLKELACYALTQSRRALSDSVRAEIVNEKFSDPMLGILGAHLILRDEPDGSQKSEYLGRIEANLERLLGPDHPDLRALHLKTGGEEGHDYGLVSPPMLRASWNLAVQASIENSGAISVGSTSEAIARTVLPSTLWLLWRPETADALNDRTDRLTSSLKDYLDARGRLESAREEARVKSVNEETPAASAKGELALGNVIWRSVQNIIGRLPLAARDAASAERAPPPPTSPSPLSLSTDEKAELSRALGVPTSLLEETLQQLAADTSPMPGATQQLLST
jgi:hypothetical protein